LNQLTLFNMLCFVLKWWEIFQSATVSYPKTPSMMQRCFICQELSIVTETAEHITDNSHVNVLYLYG
jgi:hypothetical protein